MKKIQSLFKRNYDGDRQVYNEVVPDSEWVTNGEGVPTVKWDGTSCLVRDGKLYKRYDRKLTKAASNKKRRDDSFIPSIEDFKPAPDGWEAAEPEPNEHTGHWPGWLPVDFDLPENKYHSEAWESLQALSPGTPIDGTCELVGPKVQDNPYQLLMHVLVYHGWDELETHQLFVTPPRDFDGLKDGFLRMRLRVLSGIIPTAVW